MAQVQNGDLVQVHYTGRLPDGTVFDSSENRDPLSFTAGSNELISGFSQGVIGMEQGESRTLTIDAEQAYGPRRDELVQQVPRSALPEDVKVGSVLAPSNNPDMQVHVTEITDDQATVDGNHPLAGQTLVFDVKLVSHTPSMA
jgi:peptidylprolyl isomerase